MKSLIALAAAAVIAVAATPALAKSKKKHRVHHGYYAEQYAPYRLEQPQRLRSVVRAIASVINRADSTGRCVADLGYGRYEYCGW